MSSETPVRPDLEGLEAAARAANTATTMTLPIADEVLALIAYTRALEEVAVDLSHQLSVAQEWNWARGSRPPDVDVQGRLATLLLAGQEGR